MFTFKEIPKPLRNWKRRNVFLRWLTPSGTGESCNTMKIQTLPWLKFSSLNVISLEEQLLLLKYSGSFDVIIYICNAHRSSFGEWKQWVFNFVEEKKAISKEKSRWWLMTASNCQKTCNSCWRTLWSRSLVGAFVLYHEAPEREHWVQSNPEERTHLTLTLHWCLISGL